jgi:aminopeptidase N
VVVHKGAMVWAQLRESLGDAGFWELLKSYRSGLSRGQAPWAAFEAAAGPAAGALDGWLTQSGLPGFKLRDVAVTEAEGGYQVSGRLVADGEGYTLPLELALVTADDLQRVRFQAFGAEMPFHFVTASKPLRLMLDPSEERPLRRRTTLHVAEGTAPADGVIVYGTQGRADEAAANQQAARAWAERLERNRGLTLPVKADTEVTEDDKQHSLLLFGRPSTNMLADEWADQFPVRFLKDDKGQDNALWWQGRTYTHPDFATVEIIANPAAPERTVVLFAALTARHMADTLAYTKENTTYCVFDGSHMVEAGQALCTFPDQDAVLY